MSSNPKPSTIGLFDTGLVNTVAIPSGHASSGMATDETFASAEANTIFNLAGQWQAWLNSLATNGGTAVGQLDIGYPTETPTAPVTITPFAFTNTGAQQFNATA